MNRRSFLALIVAAPFVGPVTLKTLGTIRRGPWHIVRFVEAEFDFGSVLGVAVEATHWDGVQFVRNAVRIHVRDLSQHVTARALGRRHLTQWVAELNAGLDPTLGPGVRGDEVLEGREAADILLSPATPLKEEATV